MNPLISVIIPVYNREKELFACLASIRQQTYVPLEVIVVDDGSEEKISEDKIKEILLDIRFIFYRQQNSGAPSARNKGFESSKGEYVIFWDADIVGEPDMLEKMFLKLEKNPQASFVYSNFFFGTHKMPGREFDVFALKEKNYITTTSLLRRKDFPRFDISLKRFQDWDLWLTLAEQKKQGIWIPEYLFRILPQGTMSNWLPAFSYKFPWKYLPFFAKKVRFYEEAKRIVQKKHGIC